MPLKKRRGYGEPPWLMTLDSPPSHDGEAICEHCGLYFAGEDVSDAVCPTCYEAEYGHPDERSWGRVNWMGRWYPSSASLPLRARQQLGLVAHRREAQDMAPYGWIITRDNIGTDSVGVENYSDPKPAPEAYTMAFAMYADGEFEPDYEGLMTPSALTEFHNPLTQFGMGNAGCTLLSVGEPGKSHITFEPVFEG